MNRPAINLSGSRAWATFITIGILILGFMAAWIINSYHKVAFEYNSDLGSLSIITPGSSDLPIKARSGEALTLRAGDYIVKRSGDNILESEQTITVSSDETFKINLYYTKEHLEDLYRFERPAIEEALYKEYPQILTAYSLDSGKLFLDGSIYGATLTHIDDTDQNRDSLKLMMKRQSNGEWEFLTAPPTPILSQPLYPEVPLDVITEINRAK